MNFEESKNNLKMFYNLIKEMDNGDRKTSAIKCFNNMFQQYANEIKLEELQYEIKELEADKEYIDNFCEMLCDVKKNIQERIYQLYEEMN